MEMADFFQWQYWLALGLVLLILEIFAPGFVLFCLGVGCLGGAAADLLGFGLNTQLLAFAICSLISFFTLRPLLMKRFFKDDGLKTNVDALVGQKGKVTEDFDPTMKLGRVAVGGDDWRAETENGEVLQRGSVVQVVRVESNTVIVKPI